MMSVAELGSTISNRIVMETRNLHAACFERASQSSTDGCTARAFSFQFVHINVSSSSVNLSAGDADVAEEPGVILPSGANRWGTVKPKASARYASST